MVEPVQSERTKIRWVVFFGVLLSPLVLTILTVLLGGRDNQAAAPTALIGSALAGIICGVMLGRQIGQQPATRVFLSLIFIVIITVACTAMSCVGCLASGFNVNFH